MAEKLTERQKVIKNHLDELYELDRLGCVVVGQSKLDYPEGHPRKGSLINVKVAIELWESRIKTVDPCPNNKNKLEVCPCFGCMAKRKQQTT